ncbi:unnamed protein product [Orchesella dallaii]|uniref:Uncharacterized protein n=1 Tax=Orchesella dallaii TaxID=48710 RepID=A0ABP1R1J3_9HEXA
MCQFCNSNKSSCSSISVPHYRTYLKLEQDSATVFLFMDYLLDLDYFSIFDDLIPSSFLPTLQNLIDRTWHCFQLRYQLFPIRFPRGIHHPPEPNEQSRIAPSPIPSTISDIFGLEDSFGVPTLPAHVYMENMGNDNSINGRRNSQIPTRRRSTSTSPSFRPQRQPLPKPKPSCHCQCCSPIGGPPRRHTSTSTSPSRSRRRRAAFEEILKDNTNNNADIYTRASAINLLQIGISRNILQEDSHPPQVSESDTCTKLIREGVHLLQEGKELLEDNQEMVSKSHTSSLLYNTACKLTDAVNGQLKTIREENEMLKLTNKLLRNQITEMTVAEDMKKVDKELQLEQDDCKMLKKPTTSFSSGREQDTCEEVTENAESCENVETRLLEERVCTLEKTSEVQKELISSLQERLHRQEIRYHETLTKFDETCRSMKLMFEGLRSATLSSSPVEEKINKKSIK